MKTFALGLTLSAAIVLGPGPAANAQSPVTNGLALWLDASQLAGLSDGQQVNTWTDLSGQNNHAVRQTG